MNLTGFRLVTGLSVVAAVMIFGAAPASAWGVRMSHHKLARYTDIELRCLDCAATFTIRWHGQAVYRRYLDIAGGNAGLATYTWRCSRPGRHHWTARSRDTWRTGSFTVAKCVKPFISKRRARRMIRHSVYTDGRADGYAVTELALYSCRYGRSGAWNRRRWLCDVQMEVVQNRARATYCGWGRVVKIGRRAFPSFRMTQYC